MRVCVCVQEAALQTDMDFWISVCCHFEVNEQLASLVNILNFLLQLPDDKDDSGKTFYMLKKKKLDSFSTFPAKDNSVFFTG